MHVGGNSLGRTSHNADLHTEGSIELDLCLEDLQWITEEFISALQPIHAYPCVDLNRTVHRCDSWKDPGTSGFDSWTGAPENTSTSQLAASNTRNKCCV